MAAAPIQQLRLKCQSSGPFHRIFKRLSTTCQPPTRGLGRTPTSCLPLESSLFNWRFLQSSPSTPKLTPLEWHNLSPERKIQQVLNKGDTKYGAAKWGWVIYRCTYNPALEHYWEHFRWLLEEQTRKTVAESDAPEIIDKLDWVYVEDDDLEGAPLEELKRRFRAWTHTETNYNIENARNNRGSRYECFIQVDEAALRSLSKEPHRPWMPPLGFKYWPC